MYKVYNFSGSISITGKQENEFECPVEELPEQIQILFKTTGLTMIAFQFDSGNGKIAVIYKKVA